MKLFLLFLFVSFILGIQMESASLTRRLWTMAGVAIVTAFAYFFFPGSV